MTLCALLLWSCLLCGGGEAAPAEGAWLETAAEWRLALDPRCLSTSAPLDELLRAPGLRPLWSSVCREIAARRDRLAALLAERRATAEAPRSQGSVRIAEALLALPLPPLVALEVYGLSAPSRPPAFLAVLRASTEIETQILAWSRSSSLANLLACSTFRGRPALRYRDEEEARDVVLVLDGSRALLLCAPSDQSDRVLQHLPSRLEAASLGTDGEVLAFDLRDPPALGPLSGKLYQLRLRCAGGELIEEHRLTHVEPPPFAGGARTAVFLPAGDALLRGSMRLSEQTIARTLHATLPTMLATWLEPLAPCLTGDVAVGLYPPLGGALLPRFVLRLQLADANAAGRRLEAMSRGPAPLLVQTVDVGGRRGVACEIPNNPLSLAPAAVIRDSQLWIAESASMLAVALASDDEPLPDADPSAPLYFHFDAARLVLTLADSYLPQLLAEYAGDVRPVLDPAELSRTGELARSLGSGEILARMDGDAMVVEQRSKVGGVQNTLLAPVAALAFLETVGRSLEQLRVELENDLCARRLVQLKGALEAYRTSFGGGTRYPRSLSELYARGLIEDRRTFLVPSDVAPESLRFEDDLGEPGSLRVSYRLTTNERVTIEGRPVLLYEARANRHGGRFVVFRDGGMSHYSEDLFVPLFGETR